MEYCVQAFDKLNTFKIQVATQQNVEKVNGCEYLLKALYREASERNNLRIQGKTNMWH
jgi:hypothetical protein